MSTPSPEDNNLTVSWVSYILHLIVADAALLEPADGAAAAQRGRALRMLMRRAFAA